METCGLCGAKLTGKAGEGYLRIERVEGGIVADKDICARCLERAKSSWDEVQIQLMHSET